MPYVIICDHCQAEIITIVQLPLLLQVRCASCTRLFEVSTTNQQPWPIASNSAPQQAENKFPVIVDKQPATNIEIEPAPETKELAQDKPSPPYLTGEAGQERREKPVPIPSQPLPEKQVEGRRGNPFFSESVLLSLDMKVENKSPPVILSLYDDDDDRQQRPPRERPRPALGYSRYDHPRRRRNRSRNSHLRQYIPLFIAAGIMLVILICLGFYFGLRAIEPAFHEPFWHNWRGDSKR